MNCLTLTWEPWRGHLIVLCKSLWWMLVRVCFQAVQLCKRQTDIRP
jgi:hypothetical protein